MPQLDASTFIPQLFWLAVTFVALYIVMKAVALPQVGRAIEARRNRLDSDLARAQQLKAEAEVVLAAYQQELANARAQAQQTMRETAGRLAAEAAERQRELAAALTANIVEAERRIAAAKDAALADIRGIAIDVARTIGEKLTGAPAAEPAVAAAVDRVMADRAA
jgi:F-type H+-transporting ATPase subunit b